MRAANTAIKRVCHSIPTVRDISLDLNAENIIIVGSNYKKHSKALKECLLRLETLIFLFVNTALLRSAKFDRYGQPQLKIYSKFCNNN